MSTPAFLDDVSWKAVALALPLAMAAILGGAVAARFTAAPPAFEGPALSAPQTVTIAPRRFEYRLPGVFYRDGREVDPPLETAILDEPLVIMKYQVSAASYMECVAEGLCAALGSSVPTGTWPYCLFHITMVICAGTLLLWVHVSWGQALSEQVLLE